MAQNGISTLPSKELKQLAKLNLASADRQADGNPRFTYDITLLPTQYSGNTIVENPHPGGLVDGRPWITFSPLSLFASGEQGVWYDPSDFSTMFQDAAGTIPVTAVGQPVGLILDKRNGINIGSELITNGNFITNINGWTAGSDKSNISWADGKLRVSTLFGDMIGKSAYQAFPVVAGKTYKITGNATIVSGIFTTVQIALRNGTDSGTSTLIASSAITLGSGEAASFIYTATSTTTLYLHCRFFNTSTPATVDFDNISAYEISSNYALQSTTTSRPILQVDGSGKYYLSFDGVDDWLVTRSINFTTTSKINTWVGNRKTGSEGVFGRLYQLSIDVVSNNSVFFANAPTATAQFSAGHKGGFIQSSIVTNAAYNSPFTSVLTQLASLTSPFQNTVRINGSEQATNTSSPAGSVYGNYPLYIGTAGSASYFNGRLYSLIVRGAASTTQQITDTEKYVAGKTGVTL